MGLWWLRVGVCTWRATARELSAKEEDGQGGGWIDSARVVAVLGCVEIRCADESLRICRSQAWKARKVTAIGGDLAQGLPSMGGEAGYGMREAPVMAEGHERR